MDIVFKPEDAPTTVEQDGVEPMTGMIEQLKQLITPVWDGDLICKDYRTKLHEAGLADKASGFNFLTAAGIRLCVLLQLLK